MLFRSGVDVELYRMYDAVAAGTIKIRGTSIDLRQLTEEAFSKLASAVATECDRLWSDDWDIDVIVVTGGGNGIGRALCERFHRAGAAGIAVIDLEEDSAGAVAETIGGLAMGVDVRSEEQLAAAIARTEAEFGRIDLMCSNAGIGAGDIGAQGSMFTATTIYLTPTTLSAITVNFLMSLAGGLLSGYIVSRGDAFWTYSSGLAGIIAASAGNDLYHPIQAMFVAIIGVAFMYKLHYWVERRFKIDDAVGAIAVHGYAGCFGVVAAGVLLWGHPS